MSNTDVQRLHASRLPSPRADVHRGHGVEAMIFSHFCLMRLFRNATLYLFFGSLLVSIQVASGQTQKDLDTFDKVWQIVDQQHFDPNHNGVDWDAARSELRPMVKEAADTEEVRTIINGMLDRLGQSHFKLIPKEELANGKEEAGDDKVESKFGDCGLDLRMRDQGLLVTRVEADGPADQAGVKLGWILTTIDGETTSDLIASKSKSKSEKPQKVLHTAWKIVMERTYGSVESEVILGFLDDENKSVELTIRRSERDAEPYDFPGLPTLFLNCEARIIDCGWERIGVIRWTNWFKPIQDEIDRAIDSMADCDGIILDLRGNTGGDGHMVDQIAGRFFSERIQIGEMKMRRGVMKNIARPRGNIYTGPLAILVDETTGSASEVFAGGMQSVARARVFGETSVGAVLPAMTALLPNGDSLLYAMSDFHTADGTRLEGRGVIPDVVVPLKRSHLIAGKDGTLDEAVAWITTNQDADATIANHR